ncbi:RagB/SusD family nutrient uptake outer membrane protein [Arachidicoccus sp.]|uniref:RagB/SusD family nutrient uptake outer membrane protein n=1 Tax=Arachidicoccus sp. TaxID=1872624 RepID=UPI003D1B9094
MNIKKVKNLILITTAVICFSVISCNKLLDEKSDKSLIVPESVADYQAALDNTTTMNNKSASWDEGAADNFYLPTATFNSQSTLSQNAYLWIPFVYNGPYNDWANLYNVVYISNLALEGIAKIQQTDVNENNWNNVKGSALFFRAQSILQTVFIFCKAYDSTTAGSDYGIALRLSSDFNQKSVRSSLKNAYKQIISDLTTAIPLLPVTPLTVYRPSKPAAYALLARVYLSMRDYPDAGKYADSCLQLKNDLMDYNSLSLNTLTPFKQLNKEVIFQRIVSLYSLAFISPTTARVDTLLYASYDNNDLRKQAFFYPLTPGYIFKGTYNGNISSLFTGIATDEVYLMRAECYARENQTEKAMNDLNTLLKTRWKTGMFVPLAASNSQQALQLILKERRKELIFRCLRWMDIKRLNKEGANISLKRIVNGQTSILSPNDNRFALPLPQDIINLSGMPQNKY